MGVRERTGWDGTVLESRSVMSPSRVQELVEYRLHYAIVLDQVEAGYWTFAAWSRGLAFCGGVVEEVRDVLY